MCLTLVVGLAFLATRASVAASLDAWSGSAAEWLRGVDRSEAQLRTAVARGCVEPADREATIAQIRAGAASLRTLLLATIDADSMLAGPLIAAPPPQRPQASGATASFAPPASSPSRPAS